MAVYWVIPLQEYEDKIAEIIFTHKDENLHTSCVVGDAQATVAPCLPINEQR